MTLSPNLPFSPPWSLGEGNAWGKWQRGKRRQKAVMVHRLHSPPRRAGERARERSLPFILSFTLMVTTFLSSKS